MRFTLCIKKLLLVCIVANLGTAIAYGQELRPYTMYKAKTDTFITKKLPGNSIMCVLNSKNTYYTKPHNYSNVSTVQETDRFKLLSSFTNIFDGNRLKQLASESFMQMQIYVNSSGKILEIMFYLKKDTSITATELEALEKMVKNNISFNLKPEETKAGEFFVISQLIKYSQILDKP
jgi:hypothetical protein